MGLRAHIIIIAYGYSVRTITQNVSKNLLRVVSSGDDVTLDCFYKDVVAYCTSIKVGLRTEQITRLEEYLGLEPEWSRYESMFYTEQISKGVDYLQKDLREAQ